MIKSLPLSFVVMTSLLCVATSAQQYYPGYAPYAVRAVQPAVMRHAAYQEAVGLNDWKAQRAAELLNGPYDYAAPALRYAPQPFPINYGPSPNPYYSNYNARSPQPAACNSYLQDDRDSLARYNYRRPDGQLDKYVKKNLYGDPTIFHRNEPLRNTLRFLFP
jgi:hypothetical protein